MKEQITALLAVTAAIAVGAVIRQIFENPSDNVGLWKSVTDELYED